MQEAIPPIGPGPAEADNLGEERRSLHAGLRLDPDSKPASLALLLLDQQMPTS